MRPIMQRERLDFGYELFIAAISILAVFNSLLSLVPGVDPDAANVVLIINAVLTLLFIYDFLFRLITASDRSAYFLREFGWADLLAIVPQFRVFRLFRVFKAYRLVHTHGLSRIRSHLSRNRSESALYLLVLMVILIIEAGAFLVLQAERASPEANILTAVDAIWWAYVTITTVGYGDRYPVTGFGRLVGILVLTTGVAVFATFAGYISSKLLAAGPDEEKPGEPVPADGDTVAAVVAELDRLMAERGRIDAELAARIDRLEAMVDGSTSGAGGPE